MSSNLLDLLSLSLRCEVLVRVPLQDRPALSAVCKHLNSQLKSAEFRSKRFVDGWGAEVYVSHLESTTKLMCRLQRLVTTFPNFCGAENTCLYTDTVSNFNDWGSNGVHRFIQIAQTRIGGPQVPGGSVYERLFGLNKKVHPLRMDPKSKSCPARIRDMWWIFVRSLMDGTPLPTSVDIVAYIQVEDFDDDHYCDRFSIGVKLVALVRAGSEYALLTTCSFHEAFHVYLDIQAWVGVAADWGKSVFMSFCRDFVRNRKNRIKLLEVDCPHACSWNDSWDHSVDYDPNFYVDDSDEEIDLHGPNSHTISAWPFSEPLVIKCADEFCGESGFQFVPGTPGVHVLPSGSLCSDIRSHQFTSLPSAPQCARTHVETTYDEVVDANIPDNGEVSVSSEEAFARTAERHISAERWGIPAAHVSSDWAQPARAELDESTIQMSDVQASLEVSNAESSSEKIHCLEFSRTPKSFHAALDMSSVLKECQHVMKEAGFACKLESGTRLYLLPEQYDGTRRAIADLNLQSRHVVTSARFVLAVTDAIAGIHSREQVKEKKRQRLHVEQEVANTSDTQNEFDFDVPRLIKNTFIHIPLPTSLCSMSSSGPVTASTTDAHPRNGRNPR
eukprot:TRINITY_DN64771_c0_g1_i1.p1 TRINITY_DN64771_c0_g1~~TRINITY_DN64771_c0_g1_i1.p1  ORF type:complete len:615 (+),score=50.05 TRINITY_DN64771_c0_g1_i1:70-1914(+)